MKGLVPGLLGSEARLKGVQMCPFYQSHRFHSTNTKNCKEEIWNVKKKHSVLSECQSSCLTMAVHLRMMDDKNQNNFPFDLSTNIIIYEGTFLSKNCENSLIEVPSEMFWQDQAKTSRKFSELLNCTLN